jgi:MFS family permease
MAMSCRELLYLVLSLLMLTLSNMSFAAFTSFFPPAMAGFGIRQTLIAPIFSAFMVAQLVTSSVSGVLATRFGRQPVLAFGVVCVSVGPVLFALVPDIAPGQEWPQVGLFVACRMVMGVGGALVQTVTMSTLADTFPRSRARVLSLANSAGSLAWTVGPPVGGVLYAAGGFRLPFLVAGLPPPLLLCAILACSPRKVLRAGGGEEQQLRPPTRADLRGWLRAVSTVGLYLPPVAAAIVSAKWATFDMGVTLWMMGEFDFSIQQASLCFTCASLAFVICSPISGYVGDKIPKHQMKQMIVAGLLLNFCNASSLQWSQGWALSTRMAYAYVVCFLEGLCSTVTFACALPDCHRTAELARQRGGPAVGVPAEASTNNVTSIFVTVQTVGGLLGPFLGAPLLAGTSNPFGLRDNLGTPFRVAIPTMCSGMLAMAVLMIALMAGGCVPNRKGEDGEGGGGMGGARDGDDGETEGLVNSSREGAEE